VRGLGHDRARLEVVVERDEQPLPLGAIIRYAAQQGLIPRAYAVDELFDDTMRRLEI
jgi:hypothetical protein